MTNQNTFGRTPNGAAKSENVIPLRPAALPSVATTDVHVNDAASAAATAKAQKSGKKLKRAHQNQFFVFLNFCFSLLVFALLALGGAAYWGANQYSAQGPLDKPATYMVRQGASLSQIADALETRGIISNAFVFQTAARATGRANALKAGEFAFEPAMSMQQVMDVIVRGKSIEFGVTIVEGMTVYQAFERIAANDAFMGPMPDELPAEGSMLADTKLFPRGTARTEVIERLSVAQKELIDELWASRAPDLPLKDINEFVTLASIVEKETGVGAERPQVASVFFNRLNRGIRLQSDPTIIYGIFGGQGKPSDRPIYRSDIDKPTPYNTYTIDALPPGPIAIPGRAALEAVANPAKTDYLYFVADGTGGHVFATTLDEHNANVRKWRQIERQREADAAATQPSQAQ